MIRFVLLTAVLAEQECSWKRINSCTDQIEGAVFFDDVFNENESVLIKDMAVIIRGDVTVEKIRIDKCGYLTVLDSDKPIKINAMHIDVVDGGELQIGSPTCRYTGNLDIELYGTRAEQLALESRLDPDLFCDHGYCNSIHKAILVMQGGLIEIHGKEKHSWTHLNDHLFANNQPVPTQVRKEERYHIKEWGPRLVLHIFSGEGDLRTLKSFRLDGKQEKCQADCSYCVEPRCEQLANATHIEQFLDRHFSNVAHADDIVFGVSAGFIELTTELTKLIESLVPVFGSSLSALLNEPTKRQYSQFAFIYERQVHDINEVQALLTTPSTTIIDSPLNGEFEVLLSGEKSGSKFTIDIDTKWDRKGSYNHLDSSKPDFDIYDEIKEYVMTITHTTKYDREQLPIITLAEPITTWETGDRVIIGSTDYDVRHSEVFTLVDCGKKCGLNQFMLDRPATYDHWGRVDQRTGLDQRAEVGLLSRNIRFYGSETDQCEYAESRCSGEAEDGPCPGNRVPKPGFESAATDDPFFCHNEKTRGNCESRNFCHILIDNEPEEGGKVDFHGAHFFFRDGTRNAHLSHIELFNVGQAQLARYPVHFHFDENFEYRRAKYGESERQSVSHLSIHDSNSRFVTIHATNDTIVRDVVGYNTFGHGFFIEDGIEENNVIEHNLGILVKPGIILPTDRSETACHEIGKEETFYEDTPTGRVYEPTSSMSCEMLSVFWISNANNAINNNAAIGGEAGFWAFAHVGVDTDPLLRLRKPPIGESGHPEWRNNKASASNDGFRWQFGITNDPPTKKFSGKYGTDSQAQFSKARQVRLQTGDYDGRWSGGLVQTHLVGWKIHHTVESGMWIAQESLTLTECQFSDNRKSVVFANGPVYWGAVKEIKNNLWVGRSKNPGSRKWLTDDPIKGLTSIELNTIRIDKTKPLPLYKNFKVYGLFLRDDILREHTGSSSYNNRGLLIYDTSTMPMTIESNSFYDFINHSSFTAAIDLANTHFSKAMSAKMCFMRDNHYTNVPIRMNFARINQTFANGDAGTPYGPFGLDLESKDGKKYMDWQQPARRIFSEGELALGCIDLDGTTVGRKGSYSINQLQKADFIDGPDCFAERTMNANVCPLVKTHETLAVQLRGNNANWNSINNHWLIQNHHIVDNNDTDWITFVTKELGDIKNKNDNLITFQANGTYLITTPPGFDLHGTYGLYLKNAEQHDWIHLAFCLKGGTPSNVQAKYIFQNNDRMGSTKTKSESEVIKEFPDIEPLVEVDTLAELELINGISWHFDKRNGWMHLKMVERADRRKGGMVHAKMIAESESYSYNASDYYACSPEYGCLRISFDLDETTVDNEFECTPFPLDNVNDDNRVELCSECGTHDDCGEWRIDHMKCRQSRCVCGDNWLPASLASSHCRLLNTKPAPSYEQFTPEMCDNYKTCDEQLEQCLIQCNADDTRCPQMCLRDHAVCENS